MSEWWKYKELNSGNMSLRSPLDIQADVLGRQLDIRIWSLGEKPELEV